ncbi:hypothetical protein [uncultured Flavonifractor sp.]|uniref:hypothetical protein n=1 Tax=uncultured Flavonifractor sp. TaxID=1193534 RepID=UPI00263861EB|nr:hypothetical protein [uncultured Flavonifractor sp.]
MRKDLYFKELGIVLSRSEFTALPEQDSFLPVVYEGRPLCRVDATGSVFYHQDNVNSLERESACRRVTDSAAIVQEYLTLLERAPTLHAAGLNKPYRALAEFNGTVLAGRQTDHGAKFVTWDWDFNHAGLNQGHYYEGDYSGAKQDFAVRSGLVPHERQFTPEQLMEIYQQCFYVAFSSELSREQGKVIQEIQDRIQELVPDYRERIMQSLNEYDIDLAFFAIKIGPAFQQSRVL